MKTNGRSIQSGGRRDCDKSRLEERQVIQIKRIIINTIAVVLRAAPPPLPVCTWYTLFLMKWKGGRRSSILCLEVHRSVQKPLSIITYYLSCVLKLLCDTKEGVLSQ